ncbi:MAG: orotidine-5'-phosphate decarboxylase [Acidiferrobacteraceae bacterium]
MSKASAISGPRLIVALDVPTQADALALAERLDARLCRVKIGLELFAAAGPVVVEQMQKLGFEVFLDLKFHDIPNTVMSAVRSASGLGVWMITVHALGGRGMLEAACTAVSERQPRPKLVAVTILTSHGEADLGETGITGRTSRAVERLAQLAGDCGCDGVVCSPRETALLRLAHGPAFLLVTPGIRGAGGPPDDQRRTATPLEALKRGASYLVVGRPITGAPDPAAALAALDREIAGLS